MHNAKPITSWSLPSETELKNIQREAGKMRAQFVRGLVRRIFAGRA